MSRLMHEDGCTCWQCMARAMGLWLDRVAAQTVGERWILFGTTTFATKVYPWAEGFPTAGTGRPNPEYAHHLFEEMIQHLNRQTCSAIDYVVADQFGSRNGRFHQHWLLSGDENLEAYPRKELWSWLKERAGFNRILPFERGAAYYVARYIGRDVATCDWQVEIGDAGIRHVQLNVGGGVDVVSSAAMKKDLYHMSYAKRHK